MVLLLLPRLHLLLCLNIYAVEVNTHFRAQSGVLLIIIILIIIIVSLPAKYITLKKNKIEKKNVKQDWC